MVIAVRASGFLSSIAINTHLSYTDGAYANVSNVAADLTYLGVSTIRDAVPNPNGGIPAANQISALQTLAAQGIKFDLVTAPNQISLAQTMAEIQSLNTGTPGSVIAVEGPNEINNQPVTYNGLTGQAAATAFQTDLYSAIHKNTATSGIAVYNFTGGLASPLTVAGSLTRNSDGSYTLVNGQTGFPVTLPTGTSTITISYTGTIGSGLFSYPGAGQQTGITYGTGGTFSYTYNNTSGAPRSLYVDISDYNQTATLTNIQATGPGSATNLVTFDPNLSLAGQADAANIHPYASANNPFGPLIASNYQAAYGSPAPGARVITETGYNTDPNAANSVSQAVQAQQIVNGLLDAYQSGVATTYLYELLDEKSDPSNTNPEMHYGLFNFDNTPKLAAVAVHNLTGILADPANANFTTGSLNYTETGNTSADNAMLLEKSTGVFDIALWNETAAGTLASNNVTIGLGQTYQNVKVYDVITDTSVVYQNVSSVTVAVGADPMIVEIDPNMAAAINPASLNLNSIMGFASKLVSATSAPPTLPSLKTAASMANSIPGIAVNSFIPKIAGSIPNHMLAGKSMVSVAGMIKTITAGLRG